MPTSITASNGTSYHLWQLPEQSAPEPEKSISFTVLDNELSDSYRSTRLFGSNTGNRRWRLTFPTLAHLDILPNTVTDPNGVSLSREQYVWSVYNENRLGDPFVYQDPDSGQYYLVDFEEEELTYQRMKVKLYSSGLAMRQRRIQGVTVFDIGAVDEQFASPPIVAWLKGADFDTPDWPAAEDHTGTSHGSSAMAATGAVVLDTTGTNGIDTVQFNVASNDGLVAGAISPNVVYEVWIVMKMREATFSNNAGIITGSSGASAQILTGSSGTTKFTNPSLSGFLYELDGVEYAQSDMQAPMNAWGLVHLRYTTGWTVVSNDLQFGKNRTTAGTYAEMDVGEILALGVKIPMMTSREITEHFIKKWGLTA